MSNIFDIDPETRRQLEKDDRQPLIFGAGTTLMIAVLASMAGRMMARRISKTRLKAEDWTIIAALLLNLTHLSLFMASTSIGQGRRFRLILAGGLGALKSYLQYAMSMDCLYIVSSNLTRVSILLFYRSLFSIARSFKICVHVVLVFVICQSIAFFFVNIFQCNPVEKFWNRTIPGTCPQRRVWLLLSVICNIVADLTILILPAPVVWNLQLGIRKKLALCAVFLLGGLSCVFAVLRVPTLFGKRDEEADHSYDGCIPLLYGVAECSIGIVCACVPLMGPLIRSTKVAASFSNMYSGSNPRQHPRHGEPLVTKDSRNDDYCRLEDLPPANKSLSAGSEEQPFPNP